MRAQLHDLLVAHLGAIVTAVGMGEIVKSFARANAGHRERCRDEGGEAENPNATNESHADRHSGNVTHSTWARAPLGTHENTMRASTTVRGMHRNMPLETDDQALEIRLISQHISKWLCSSKWINLMIIINRAVPVLRVPPTLSD